MTVLEKLSLYLSFPFVRYALIVGVLIALCSSLLGVTLVLKRFSFIGDGLSHVAFGAMAIAGVLRIENELPLVLVITVLCAVLLLRTGQNAKIKGDAAVAMISVGSLAVGYLLMNLFSTSSNLSGGLLHPLRLHLHPDPAAIGGVALRGALPAGDRGLCLLLSQDFRRHL